MIFVARSFFRAFEAANCVEKSRPGPKKLAVIVGIVAVIVAMEGCLECLLRGVKVRRWSEMSASCNLIIAFAGASNDWS